MLPTPPDNAETVHMFIAPHFDDAVLSCGGTMHQLARAGEVVYAMTIMGGVVQGELPYTPILEDLHQRWQAGENPLQTRKQEDINALHEIGVKYIHLQLTDCVYRFVNGVALYPSEASLFGEVHPDDPAPKFMQSVTFSLTDYPIVVYVPLGVGHHVDHQIVRDWGLYLLSQKSEYVSVKFYAEYPYLNADHAIDEALRYFSILLTSSNVILREHDIQAKINAISHYKSQISTFWEDLGAMEADVKHSSTHPETGKYVERFWDIAQQGATK